MSLSKRDADYRHLANYEQVVEPEYRKLEDVNWQLVRGLILEYRQQKQAVYLATRFYNQPRPKYYQACGHLIPPFIIRQHKGFSIRCKRPSGSRWAPVTQKVILDEETYYHYNNQFARRFEESGGFSGQPVKAWGREEMEAAWLRRNPNPRKFMAEHLNTVARFLRAHEGLAILLETGAPRLRQLSGEKKLLGYVAYFFDCWQRFHDYEQATPAPMVQVDSLTKPAPGKLSLRQVALIYVYTGLTIPPNADAIANQYGHESGRTLYKRYLEVAQTAGRVGADIQGKKLAPMIADMTAIVPHLPEESRQQVESELQTLEKRK